jgi:3-phosphoinositide dependent protein kinase-1
MPLVRRDTFVGTVNYQSPEVINGEEQGFGVDIWALGCVLFKMFTGYVPFKGTNSHTVYKDIKNRNIGWPDRDVVNDIIPLEAQDLINRMIQIEPSRRLGVTLESIQTLKSHPYFEGVDFSKIS